MTKYLDRLGREIINNFMNIIKFTNDNFEDIKEELNNIIATQEDMRTKVTRKDILLVWCGNVEIVYNDISKKICVQNNKYRYLFENIEDSIFSILGCAYFLNNNLEQFQVDKIIEQIPYDFSFKKESRHYAIEKLIHREISVELLNDIENKWSVISKNCINEILDYVNAASA